MDSSIILVGIGHVFDIGDNINTIIRTEKPNAIAIELDNQRMQFLYSSDKNKTYPNLLYRTLALVQNSIAKKFNMTPGSEMKAVIHSAHENNISLFLIDMDARLLLQKLWESLGLKEKIVLVFSGLFSLLLPRKKIEQEVYSFETNSDEKLNQLEKTTPKLKRILIDDRNEFMSAKLLRLAKQHEKIIAFVGEGHIPGIIKLIEKHGITLRVIHLSSLLS